MSFKLFGVTLLMTSMFGAACSRAAVDYKTFPDPKDEAPLAPAGSAARTVVLAGGCFWCVEGVFEMIPGVTDVVSGYAGGPADQANYEAVSAGATPHAEVVQITYDPSRITLGRLLKVFFSVAHDPTTLNRQGPDVGKQYRSAVFFADDEQRRIAEAYISQLDSAGVFGGAKIVTTLERLDAFHPAEAYHQDFVRKNPRQGYVVQQALPKIEKAKKAAEAMQVAAVNADAPATQPAR
jgi:peptide-methionine (S)-S-oxide reductase